MNERKREVRSLLCELSVREQEGSPGESRTIEGTAIVFNRESEVLDEYGDEFREVIAPEAATMEWLGTQDIKLNLLHERGMTIARCNKGRGNLRLSVDEVGVHFSFDAPRCDIGDRALALVREGVYSGCSFEFYPKDYEVERRGEDSVLVTHKCFERLTALTIGMDPAYQQTCVKVRELPADGPVPLSPNGAPPCAPEEKGLRAEGEIEREMLRRAGRLRQMVEIDKEFEDMLFNS